MVFAEAPTLTAHLRRRLWYLSKDDDETASLARVLIRRVFHSIQEAWISPPLVLLFVLQAFMDFVMAETKEVAQLQLRTFVGAFATAVAHSILRAKTEAAIEALRLAASVAEEIEAEAPPHVQALFLREARVDSFRCHVFLAYGIITQMFVALTLVMDRESFTMRYLNEQLGPAADWVFMPMRLYPTMIGHSGLYTLLFLQITVHHACILMFRHVGEHLMREGGAANTARSLDRHSRLAASCHQLSSVFGYKLPFYHSVGLVMPMVSTVEVILAGGITDAFALGLLPLVFIYFVPQCTTGQEVEESSEDVGWYAYQGPWLEEDTPSRRTRLLALLRSSRHAYFGVPGLLVLNNHSCGMVLRRWFQTLQILLNVRGVA